ncbi:MAG: hypothetical protein ACRDE2_00050 [Chitinophagaceae bacterium]
MVKNLKIKRPSQVLLDFSVLMPTVIRIVAYDLDFPKRIFYDRTNFVEKEEKILIKLPLFPKKLAMSIASISDDNDLGITILKIKKKPLIRELVESQIHDPLFREFVYFIESFAFNAAYLETGNIYTSAHKHFAIDYLDVIKKNDGSPTSSPAMIKEGSGFMKFAKQRILSFTIPGIVAIGLHEFSHNFLNSSPESEEEADLNSLITYLGLGFPFMEADNTWSNIYNHTKTDLNKQRASTVIKLLLDYSKEFGFNE